MKPPHMLVSWAENIAILTVLVAFSMINQSRKHKTERKRLQSFGSAVKIQNIVRASTCQTKSVISSHIAVKQKRSSTKNMFPSRFISMTFYKRRAKPLSQLVKSEACRLSCFWQMRTLSVCVCMYSSEVAGSNHNVAWYTNYGFDHANTFTLFFLKHTHTHTHAHTRRGWPMPTLQ